MILCCLFGRIDRHGEYESRTAARVGRVEPYAPAHLGGYIAAYAQSKAGSLHEFIEFGKAFEDLLCLIGRHAWTCVRNRESNFARILFKRAGKFDFSLGGMLAGIGEQVDDNLLDAARIGTESEGTFELRFIIHTYARLEPMLSTADCGIAHKRALSLFVVDTVIARVHCRCIEDIVQKHRKHFCIVHDMSGKFIFFFFGEAAVR